MINSSPDKKVESNFDNGLRLHQLSQNKHDTKINKIGITTCKTEKIRCLPKTAISLKMTIW